MSELKQIAFYVSEKISVDSIKIKEYITTDNMLPNRGGVEECSSFPKVKNVTKYNNRDILISNIRPYFKKIWYSDRIGGCSNDVLVFRIKDEDIWNSKFVYYVLSQDSFFNHMMAGANGTKMPRGNKKTIPEFIVPNFSINKQIKIANILSTYDNLIENNQKQIKLLEEAAQRLYKEWFVDLRFPGYEDTEIIDGVPEAWKKERVKNVIGKVIRSKQIKASEYLKKGLIPIIDQSRDFIAGYTNDNESVVKMDKPVIVFGDHTRILKYIQFPFAKGADGTQLIISNEENLPQSLLYLSLLAVDLSNYHYARHFKYLKEELIFVPTKHVSDEFDKIITPVLVQIQKLRDISTKAVEARDRLLPKLMNGEMEV